MVIKSPVWSNGERVNQSNGRWPEVLESTVSCPNGSVCCYTKKDVIFFLLRYFRRSHSQNNFNCTLAGCVMQHLRYAINKQLGLLILPHQYQLMLDGPNV